MNLELNVVTKTSTTLSYTMGTCCSVTSVYGLRYKHFAISVPFEVCAIIYSECNFQGTILNICAPRESLKSIAGTVKSYKAAAGYSILFYKSSASKLQT